MMDTKSIIIGLIVGGISGIAAGYYFTKKKCDEEKQLEIDELREYYGTKVVETEEKTDEVCTTAEAEEITAVDDTDFVEYSKILKDNGYCEVGNTTITLGKKDADEDRDPYIIDPDRFGEMALYKVAYYTMFSDDTIINQDDELVDDADVTIGMANLLELDEETGKLYVRNEELMTDYEITYDDRTYADTMG